MVGHVGGLLRRFHIVAIWSVAACGGKLNADEAPIFLDAMGSGTVHDAGGSPTDGAMSGDAGRPHSDGGARVDAEGGLDAGNGGNETGDPIGDDASLPAVGSTACDRFDGTCVLCNDGQWHCVDFVFSQCPPGVEFLDSCPSALDAGGCLACESDGATMEWHCGPDASVSVSSARRCSP
jgi:hypothetical protein